MKLTELLPLEKWVELEEEISDKFGIAANVFDVNGIRITNYKNWVNRLCPVIKANEKGQSFICAVAHMNIAMQAMQNKKPVIEECDAGLAKPVVPIFAGNEFLGAICGCGLLLEDGEVDAFLVHKITGIPEGEIESLSNDIETIAARHVEALINFMEKRINQIVTDFENQTSDKAL
ncbi:MAG: PocR ligand-binding domain-containing protein [Deltaproteobacteria bacterium]|nr:MAG: PocR ligand-binding domain-containing protein [Deltaproteobacteria bacterium]